MRRLSLFIVGFIASFGLSACSILEMRSESSGYGANGAGPSTAQEFYRERGAKNFEGAREQLGISNSRDLSEAEVAAIRSRIELSKLENALQGSQEKKQYYSLKPYFRSDAERAYFLKLPTREARERWAQSQGVTSNETTFDSGVTELIERNDIARGMSRGAVKQSWGEPDFVETAGEPMYGNERWRYTKTVSSEEGYKNETRIIFFEAGRVVGWETI